MNDEPLTECEVHFMLSSPGWTDICGAIHMLERPGSRCTAPVEKLINFRGGVSVQGGTPKFHS